MYHNIWCDYSGAVHVCVCVVSFWLYFVLFNFCVLYSNFNCHHLLLFVPLLLGTRQMHYAFCYMHIAYTLDFHLHALELYNNYVVSAHQEEILYCNLNIHKAGSLLIHVNVDDHMQLTAEICFKPMFYSHSWLYIFFLWDE